MITTTRICAGPRCTLRLRIPIGWVTDAPVYCLACAPVPTEYDGMKATATKARDAILAKGLHR